MLEQVRKEGLLSPGRPVVVLYSGGRDSTCLLDLAARVTGAAAVRALHVNYGLRDEADADERHCRLACEQLAVELTVERPRRPATGNLQAWAREARYTAAATLAAGQADVATGHTATDQVETILYRLASSPSRRALLGMSTREGAVIRPLLSFTRAETAAYCRHRQLAWREDATNDSDVYARGRIRTALVPALEAAHPAAAQNVLALANILRDEAAVLDELVGEAVGGRDEIELARLRELPPALRRLVVQRLADAAAGGLAPGAARRADEIAALNNGNALDIGSGLRAVVAQRIVRFERLDQ
ncbi:MAG TPA: tRNA lysidine(34) synthetase TilS [Solirubrobacteraceae bacterium]|jgi:tRNA(Ile)-lysidine synthase|nr:tRNA lysidine(34) synthetase TilS [Solirubrobacteraceae bacterium]